MKNSAMNGGRFVLSTLAAAVLAAVSTGSWALGLGRLSVQSALGESLKAEIDITSITPDEAGSLNVRIASPEAYRAAGVDYNAVLPVTQAQVQRRDGRTFLRLSSERAVNEPFVDVILEITWASGRLVREYTLLLDPPTRAAPPTMAAAPVAPVFSAAPAPAPAARTPAPAPDSAPRVPPSPRPAWAGAPAPAPAAAPAPATGTAKAAPATGSDQYTVRSGDTLYRIATRTQPVGVSLDQMLVALFRGNPRAFIDANMNLLKAGSVLSVPSAEQAQRIEAAEARQVIQAQSADFGAFRQRLAGAVPAVPVDERSRQATGKVQAQVEDRKTAGAAPPDKLTLSQGGVKPEQVARVSRESEQKEQSTRVAELSRNVEELKKLKDVTPSVATAPAAPAAASPSPAASSTAAAAPALPFVPPAPLAPPMPAASAAAPAPVAVAPAASAVPADAASAAAVAAAPAPEAKPAAVKAPVPVAPPEPGFMATLLDNPLVLPGAGVLVALLAGLGVYRLRSKVRKDSGETSFLESRLQPDSFFGASGGQRIDTRDATGASSSMSYSLSQLDAIGDVDPVAEADVYLAYGRDLQAEEILKEAMRSNPDRLAIRTKLLEVYAKRRDTKGFELLATQLYGLTRGEGDEWHKAQEMGSHIDPENPLYRPGGRPAVVAAGGTLPSEPLGASTMPQSVMPATATSFVTTEPADEDRGPLSGIDLDLDLDQVEEPVLSATASLESTQPMPEPVTAVDFDVPTPTVPAAAKEAAVEFDFGALSLDLETPAAPVQGKAAAQELPDLGGVGLATAELEPETGDADPLVRKLELAEEFRQIGDTEGARDLLEEVIAKASGPLKSRAQGLLTSLA